MLPHITKRPSIITQTCENTDSYSKAISITQVKLYQALELLVCMEEWVNKDTKEKKKKRKLSMLVTRVILGVDKCISYLSNRLDLKI